MTRRSAQLSLWMFVLALSTTPLLGACGEDGPMAYSTTNPRAGRGGDDEPDAGGGDEAGEGGDGEGGNGAGGMGGDGEGGDGEGGDGEGGDGEGGEGCDGEGGEGGDGEAGSGAIDLPDSPDNPWVAFIEIDGSGFGQLNFIKADGTDRHSYGGGTLAETEPTWSPDGTKLAFTAVHESDGAQLHVLDFESGDDTVLDIDGLATMTRPRFTPDGDTIVFAGAATSADKSALYRTDAADGGATAITEPEEGDGGHDIAHDGTIYFARKLSGNTFDVFSIDVDDDPDDDPTRVTTGSTIIGGVAVHPDGTRIMFAKNVSSSTQLVERTLSDGTQRDIGDQGDEQPAYFAGGDGLVLSRDSFDEDAEIATTDADGELTTRLTDTMPFDTAPAVSSIESDDVDVTQF
jgi:hypothetical protein